MSDRGVVFVGRAGEGKSTLINSLFGIEKAVVSHKIKVDGTKDITSIPVPKIDKDLVAIDTPGLLSKNHASLVTEKIQNRHPNMKVLIVLVMSRATTRLDESHTQFESIKSDLVGNVPFCIIFTKTGEFGEEKLQELREIYPQAVFFEDTDKAKILSFFSNGSNFAKQKLTVAVERAASLPPAPCVVQVAQIAKPIAPTAAAKTPVKVKRVPGARLGLPVFMDELAGYNLRVEVSPAFSAPIARLLEIKRTGGSKGKEFRNLALKGDVCLKFCVLSTLSAAGEEDELETRASKLIRNDDNSALNLFYKKHMEKAHARMFPDEADKISDHGKAQMVEALLELTRLDRNESFSFKDILAELFSLVGEKVSKK